jgi:hypothetical protein
MSTIAIGDIHGNRAALDDLLARLTPELAGGDTVVFLGDKQIVVTTVPEFRNIVHIGRVLADRQKCRIRV